jgi:hypothetical protein
MSDNDGGSPLMSSDLVEWFWDHVERALNTTRDIAQVKLDLAGAQGKGVSSFRNLINHEAHIIKMGIQSAFLLPDSDPSREEDPALDALIAILNDTKLDEGSELSSATNRKDLTPMGHGLYALHQFDLLFDDLAYRLIRLFRSVLEDPLADENVGEILREDIFRSRRSLRELLRERGLPV